MVALLQVKTMGVEHQHGCVSAPAQSRRLGRTGRLEAGSEPMPQTARQGQGQGRTTSPHAPARNQSAPRPGHLGCRRCPPHPALHRCARGCAVRTDQQPARTKATAVAFADGGCAHHDRGGSTGWAWDALGPRGLGLRPSRTRRRYPPR